MKRWLFVGKIKIKSPRVSRIPFGPTSEFPFGVVLPNQGIKNGVQPEEILFTETLQFEVDDMRIRGKVIVPVIAFQIPPQITGSHDSAQWCGRR